MPDSTSPWKRPRSYETGRIIKELRAASEPSDLIAALTGLRLPLERVGLEACSLTAWLHDELRAAGLPAICIKTRSANAAMKTMPNKTDRNDARALAEIMRTGWFRQVHVKSRQSRLWRSLLVARRTVLNEMRAIENVVRAILREGGIKLGTPARAAFAGRVRELAGDDPLILPLVTPLLAILAVQSRSVVASVWLRSLHTGRRYGTGSSRLRHDHARGQSSATAIESFAQRACRIAWAEPQDGREVAQACLRA